MNSETVLKIIIWDDDVSEGKILFRVLDRLKFDVLLCREKDDFFNKAIRFKPDIIIVGMTREDKSVFREIDRVKKSLNKKTWTIFLFNDFYELNNLDLNFFIKKENSIENLMGIIFLLKNNIKKERRLYGSD
jgi:two-component SAPR family response regulator